MLALGSCSGPTETWIVNGTRENLTILYASDSDLYTSDSEYEHNIANGSPWFWPWRTDPIVSPYAGYQVTTYRYGQRPGLHLRMRVATCELVFDVPRPPDTLDVSPEWQLMRAYNDDALQLSGDWKLYRLPTYSSGWVEAEFIPQPEGYPLSPTTMSCQRASDAPTPDAPPASG